MNSNFKSFELRNYVELNLVALFCVPIINTAVRWFSRAVAQYFRFFHIFFHPRRKTDAGDRLRSHLPHSDGHKLLLNRQALSDGAAERRHSISPLRHPNRRLRVRSGALGGRHLGIDRTARRRESNLCQFEPLFSSYRLKSFEEFLATVQRTSHRPDVNHATRLDRDQRR